MKTNRTKQTINAASMADVAFLLLIFFMIVTTIVQDKGIFTKLPEISQDTQKIMVNKDRTMQILLSQKQIMVNNEIVSTDVFKEMCKKHLEHHGGKAIFSLKYNRDANYNTYIFVQNTLNEELKEKRNELALLKTNQDFSFDEIKELAKENEKYALLYEQIKTEIPMVLFEDLEFAALN